MFCRFNSIINLDIFFPKTTLTLILIELVEESERADLIGLYALPSLLGDLLQRRHNVYTDSDTVRRFAELLTTVVARYPKLIDDAVPHCNAVVNATRNAVQVIFFFDCFFFENKILYYFERNNGL